MKLAHVLEVLTSLISGSWEECWGTFIYSFYILVLLELHNELILLLRPEKL